MAIAEAEATEEGEDGGHVGDVNAGPPAAPVQKRKRRKDIARTIGRTLQLAWSADRRTFVMVLGLSLAPAAIPPIMVVLGRQMVDLVSLSAIRPVTRGQMLPIVIA